MLCPSHHPALMTRSVAQTMPFSSIHPLDSLEHAIEASGPDAVIPCDDRTVRLLHELHARSIARGKKDIAALMVRSLGAAESFPILSSRYRLLKVAREEGIRVPETCAIDSLGDLEQLEGLLGRVPWVMKVDGTSGGRGVRFVRTLEDARRFFFEAQKGFHTTRVLKRLIVNPRVRSRSGPGGME